MIGRAELIEEWMDIVASVFHAEDNLAPVWESRLRGAKELPPEGRAKVCEDYLRAIAEEIVEEETMDYYMEDGECSLMN